MFYSLENTVDAQKVPALFNKSVFIDTEHVLVPIGNKLDLTLKAIDSMLDEIEYTTEFQRKTNEEKINKIKAALK